MASTSIMRPIGPTQALSVTNTIHTPVLLTLFTNDQCNFMAAINVGTVAVAYKVSQTGVNAVLPVDGTPGDFVLPPLMEFPIIISIPALNPQVTAIAAAIGPTMCYFTPVGDQS